MLLAGVLEKNHVEQMGVECAWAHCLCWRMRTRRKGEPERDPRLLMGGECELWMGRLMVEEVKRLCGVMLHNRQSSVS